MKPQHIYKVLDLAREVRSKGKIFNPLFSGGAGLGKSEIVQDWCNRNNLPFIDLRAAYLEAPDVIGFPSIEKLENGRTVTKHNTPEFWPVDGEGVLFLDEPNRGSTSVLNTFMQLLTDRKIHGYNLPDGWMVVACINPESDKYDVNTMDIALKNRFEIFYVDYDREGFIKYMKDKNWNEMLVHFIESGAWTYTAAESLADDTPYVSPRTFSKLNTVIQTGVEKDIELAVYEAILGKKLAITFYAYMNEERPVVFEDLQANPKDALYRLKKLSKAKNYKSSLIAVTVNSLLQNYDKMGEDMLADVILSIPADQAYFLLREYSKRINQAQTYVGGFFNKYPKVKEYLRESLV